MEPHAIDWERFIAWVLGLLLIVASLGVGWAGTPYSATQAEMQDVETDPAVAVSSLGDGYVLAPSETASNGAETEASTGIVFYPGGRVHPSAYVPVLAPVVERTGATVFVPKPPLNLAVFDSAMAGPIIDAHPEIEQWYVGGHSLGGAMACRYVSENADQIAGLFLFGSYCDRDISTTDVRVLTVRGGTDTVLDRDAYSENRPNLPENRTTEVTIRGMNHSQFGVYGGQPGDSRATISAETAHDALREALIEFIGTEPTNTTSPPAAVGTVTAELIASTSGQQWSLAHAEFRTPGARVLG